MSLLQFLLLDLAGATLWSGAYLGTGWLFRRQLQSALLALARFGVWVPVVLLAPPALWVAWKYYRRRRFLAGLSVERITPEQVRARMADLEPPILVDLRSPRSIARTGLKAVGAITLEPDRLQIELRRLPAGAHLVFYCT